MKECKFGDCGSQCIWSPDVLCESCGKNGGTHQSLHPHACPSGKGFDYGSRYTPPLSPQPIPIQSINWEGRALSTTRRRTTRRRS